MEFSEVIPVLRIFSVEKATEFYLGYLGFHEDWRHTFEIGAPVFMQVSRGGIRLRLSEHHGDCCPGAALFVQTEGLEEFHAELVAKPYPYMRPGLKDAFPAARQVTVIDPFGNRIHFRENRQV